MGETTLAPHDRPVPATTTAASPTRHDLGRGAHLPLGRIAPPWGANPESLDPRLGLARPTGPTVADLIGVCVDHFSADQPCRICTTQLCASFRAAQAALQPGPHRVAAAGRIPNWLSAHLSTTPPSESR